MGKITSLSVQKRNQERVNVYIDGEFAFGLAYVAAARLHVGQELSPDEIKTLQDQDTVEKAKDSAYRLISLRPRSAMEIQQNLSKKGYDPDVITQVIDRLIELDFLNDEAFAHYWIEQRDTFKPRSHMALRQELQQKGISRSIIDQALTASDETVAARAAAEKKARQLARYPEEEFKIKLGQFLQRRGFNYALIKEISDEMWQEIELENVSAND
ncbi:MAG: RecX family transcriptional regulator [Anaerolineae bacterium]|nr:RecX family transcriptional regulator [Anaerolineae bacterium]